MEQRYVFDKVNMAVFDNKNGVWVCSVGTKRPDIFEEKLGELLELANRPIENELIEALEKAKETLENIVGYESIDGVPEYQQILDTLSKAKGEVK